MVQSMHEMLDFSDACRKDKLVEWPKMGVCKMKGLTSDEPIQVKLHVAYEKSMLRLLYLGSIKER